MEYWLIAEIMIFLVVATGIGLWQFREPALTTHEKLKSLSRLYKDEYKVRGFVALIYTIIFIVFVILAVWDW